jgi:hypothetical protein
MWINSIIHSARSVHLHTGRDIRQRNVDPNIEESKTKKLTIVKKKTKDVMFYIAGGRSMHVK